MAVPVHRKAIRASRQRLTLRQTCRSTAIRLSIALVQPSERRSWSGSPSRITVSISSSPSRIEAETPRSEEHTSELQSHSDLVCRLLLEKKKTSYSLTLAVATVAKAFRLN